jgi:hypothetical protein
MLSEDTQKEVFPFCNYQTHQYLRAFLRAAIVWNEKVRNEQAHDRIGRYDDDYYWTECTNHCRVGLGITKLGRADLLPCNCFDDFYRKLVNRTFGVFAAEELRLLRQGTTFRFDSNLLCRPSNEARGVSFDKAGNAFPHYTPLRFWADGPIDLSVKAR